MSSINMSIPHELSQTEARQRIQTLLEKVKSQFGDKVKDLHEEWNGNTGEFSFNAMGFGVSGNLSVNESDIVINGKLPFAASFFKGTVESIIRKEAEKVLRT